MIQPHGGKLIDRVLTGDALDKALEKFKDLPQLKLDEESVKDCKNIGRGVYSPLKGFMCEDDYRSVIDDMKLKNGVVWSLPILLDIDKKKADKLKDGENVGLADKNGKPIAILHLKEKYEYDKKEYAQKVFLTQDDEHPGVKGIYDSGDILLGGEIALLVNEKKTFPEFNLTPKETRILFENKGFKTIVGFQTRNPPHRAHEYLQKCGLEMCDALFINPVIGKKKSGDFTDKVILEAYSETIENRLPKDRVVLSILPTKMRYAGPKEAIFHAIIRKNFGCTHFIVGRDHAGVGNYYGSYDAQHIFDEIEDIGIIPLKFEHAFFCKKCGCMGTSKTCPHGKDDRVGPSGTIIRDLISKKELVPEEIMRMEVSKILVKADKPFVE